MRPFPVNESVNGPLTVRCGNLAQAGAGSGSGKGKGKATGRASNAKGHGDKRRFAMLMTLWQAAGMPVLRRVDACCQRGLGRGALTLAGAA